MIFGIHGMAVLFVYCRGWYGYLEGVVYQVVDIISIVNKKLV